VHVVHALCCVHCARHEVAGCRIPSGRFGRQPSIPLIVVPPDMPPDMPLNSPRPLALQVTNFFGVSSRCGTPDELKSMIDEAHR
jgi:hypothetical protein